MSTAIGIIISLLLAPAIVWIAVSRKEKDIKPILQVTLTVYICFALLAALNYRQEILGAIALLSGAIWNFLKEYFWHILGITTVTLLFLILLQISSQRR